MTSRTFERLEDSINSCQPWLNKGWLEVQEAKGRIYSGVTIDLKKIMRALEGVYPDMWSLSCSAGKAGNKVRLHFDVLIRFPSTQITNTYGDSRMIEELFVKLSQLKLSDGGGHSTGWTLVDFRGTCMHYAYDSFVSGYSHSHLSHDRDLGKEINFKSFCMGQTPLAQSVGILRAGFDEDRFTMLLHQINLFVKWESLEGVPYMKIGSVSNIPSNRSGYESGASFLAMQRRGKEKLEILTSAYLLYCTKFNKAQLSVRADSTGCPVVVDDENFRTWLKADFNQETQSSELAAIKWLLTRPFKELTRELIRNAHLEDSLKSDATMRTIESVATWKESVADRKASKFVQRYGKEVKQFAYSLFCVHSSGADFEIYSPAATPPVYDPTLNFIFRGERIIRTFESPPESTTDNENYLISKCFRQHAISKLKELFRKEQTRKSALESIS